MNDPRLGTDLGGYRIEARIGAGGMGVVYRAEELELGRKVALKLLAPELAENAGFRERFQRESRLAAAIDHPHIIPLYGTRTVDDLVFIVMRYVDGTDLKELLRRAGPLSLERALTIVGQVAGALDAAHDRGLVHRDVKPANVLVDSRTAAERSDHCYLTDFGLTKDTSQAGTLTETGHFVGTIDYVAPEQINGLRQGPATDQYALGCVLYECLTGHPPFERPEALQVLHAHLFDEPPLLSDARPDCPTVLDGVLTMALAKAPEDRHASCAAMVAAAKGIALTRTVVARTVQSPGPAGGDTRPSPRPAQQPRAPRAEPASSPAEPAPHPEAAPRRRRARMGLLLAAVVIAAGLAGAAAGRSDREESPPDIANVAAAGGMSVRFPSDWQLLALPPTIPGLAFRDPVAIGPAAGGGREGLIAGQITRSGTRLLPDELLSGEDGYTVRRDAVRLGDADAFRYPGLRPRGFSGVVTAYLLLTERGRSVIACYAASRSPRFDARCASVAASLELRGFRALALAPSAPYATAVTKLLADLTGTRAAGRRRLREARTSVGQAGALGELAARYATYGRRVARLQAPAAAAVVNVAIAAALRDIGRAFARASAAARGRAPARYESSRTAVSRGDRALHRAVSALGQLGYDLT